MAASLILGESTMKRRSLLSLLALGLTTCGLSTDPSQQVEGDIRVEVGEEAEIPGTVLRIWFIQVNADSRCPSGAVCIWEGDAEVAIGLTAGSGPTQLAAIHTREDPRFVDFSGVRVTLADLVPYPREGVPTSPDAYVAGFDIEPLAP
jgi:hypothetical protein